MKSFDILHIIAILVTLAIVLAAGCLLVCCRSQKREAWEDVPLKEGEIEQTRLGDQAGLRIDRFRFYSLEMQEPRFFLVLTPQSDKPVDRVFILNHGWSDRPESMLKALKLDEVYAKLLGEGLVQPALVVLPDVRFPDYFRRNSDSFPFPQYLTLVAEEVSKIVSLKYNIPFARSTWGIGGFSFGGYLSLDLGRRYSARFGSVSVISSFFDKGWSFWPEEPPPPGRLDSRGRGKQTTVESGPIPRLLLACGTRDRFIGSMTQLHETFQKLGIVHEWVTAPGGHTWNYWSSVLEDMYKFHLGYGKDWQEAAWQKSHDGREGIE